MGRTAYINLNTNLNSYNSSELLRTISQVRKNYLSVPILSWRKLEQRISRIVINSQWQTTVRGQLEMFGGGEIVAYLSILEFDISSVRSFLCRGRLYNAMHFHNVSLGFFYDCIYRFKKLFDESVSECRIAFGSPYRYKRRLKKANNVSISPVNTSHHCVIYELFAATEKYSNVCIFDTLHISYNSVTQPVARYEPVRRRKSRQPHLDRPHSVTNGFFSAWLCTSVRQDSHTSRYACKIVFCIHVYYSLLYTRVILLYKRARQSPAYTCQIVSCIHVWDSFLYTRVIQSPVYMCKTASLLYARVIQSPLYTCKIVACIHVPDSLLYTRVRQSLVYTCKAVSCIHV